MRKKVERILQMKAKKILLFLAFAVLNENGELKRVFKKQPEIFGPIIHFGFFNFFEIFITAKVNGFDATLERQNKLIGKKNSLR